MHPVLKTLAIGAAAVGAMAATPASARTYVGINFGFGYPAYGYPSYGYVPAYWGPPPVYWGPPVYGYGYHHGYYPRYRHGWRHRGWGHRGWGHRRHGWRGRHW